jgi:tetratricopeptide (TPR) repeat protein
LGKAFELSDINLPAFFYLIRAELQAELKQWSAALADYKKYERHLSGPLFIGKALVYYNLWKDSPLQNDKNLNRKAVVQNFEAALSWAKEQADNEMQVTALTYLGILVAEQQPVTTTISQDLAFTQARDYFDQALRITDASDNAKAKLYYNRARLLYRQQRRREALNNLKNAAEFAPQDSEIAAFQGWLHFGQNQLPEAQAAWQRAADFNPTVDNLVNLGAVLVSLRKIEEAQNCFQKAELAQTQATDSIQNWLGLCKLALGNYEAALQIFRKVVETVNPQYKAALGNLGASYVYHQKLARAEQAFEQATQNNEAGGMVVERIWLAACQKGTGKPNSLPPLSQTELDQFQPGYEPAEYEAAKWLAKALQGEAHGAYTQALHQQTLTTDKLNLFYWKNLETILLHLYDLEVLQTPPETAEPKKAGPDLTTPERGTLREYLTKRFNMNELKTVAFDLGINPDQLDHATRSEFARELIAYCERNWQLLALVERTLRQRKVPEIIPILQKLRGDEDKDKP